MRYNTCCSVSTCRGEIAVRWRLARTSSPTTTCTPCLSTVQYSTLTGTYQPSQLEAYKVCRQLAIEVTNQVVSDLAEGKVQRTSDELAEEYKAWERSHMTIKNRPPRP